MYGVVAPDVSAGSNHVGVSEMWRAHVICPSGAAAPEEVSIVRLIRETNVVKRPRTCFIGEHIEFLISRSASHSRRPSPRRRRLGRSTGSVCHLSPPQRVTSAARLLGPARSPRTRRP